MVKLLRKPRAPKPLPPLPKTPTQNYGNNKLNDYFESIDFGDDRDGAQTRDTMIGHSRTPSVVPSLVSPPPSESLPRRSTYLRTVTYQSSMSRVSFLSKEEKKFVLDPLFGDQTSLGTYVDGKSLVKPYKPRGPDGIPARPPRRNPSILHSIDIVDDIRYFDPPAFTLENFMIRLSDIRGLPIRRVREVVYSSHNYKKLTQLIAEEAIHPVTQDVVALQHFTPESQAIPPVEPRIPQQQLLIEMAAMIKQHVRALMNTEVKSVIKPLPKYGHGYEVGAAPHTEIILVEDDAEDRASQSQQFRQANHPIHTAQVKYLCVEESELPGKDAMFHSARSRFFQGSGRSQSPFTLPDAGVISPSELAILDSLVQGGKALSLKAHFISSMPDISPLARNIVYLNLSFNDFSVFPPEVLNISQLEILKLRNNPLHHLPADIHRLTNLRTLVVSFCMIQSLPIRLFALENLEYLDISYNRISFIPNEIAQLESLRELNLEGNQLPAMPSGALRLDLDCLNVKNNFMHPLFWREHARNEPQRLMDLSMSVIHKSGLDSDPSNLPSSAQTLLKSKMACDCCNGALFGPGLRIVRPVTRLFGIKNLPFMFRSCSPTCLKQFRNSKDTLSEILYSRERTEVS